MKRKKLLLSLVAVTMTIMTLATGCAKKSAESASGSSMKSIGDMHEKGLPIVDAGKYSFSLFADDSSKTGKYYMMPVLEKQTGIKVNLQTFPFEIAKEKLSLALSSGDYADVIAGWTLSDTDILKYGVDMKTFIPLEDYFKKYCPNIEKILDLPGVRDAMTAPDGHIYSIPYALEAPQVDFSPYINTKWLKKLGLQMPKTTEDLRNVLKAFKTAGLIPFSADPNNKHLNYLAGWFGMSMDDLGFTMADDKLTFGANTAQYKNSIKYLNSLYKEGLIDPEIFTQDLNQWKAKGAQDKYGVVIAYGSGDFMPYAAGSKPDWEPLPVLTSGDGSTPVWLRSSYGTSVLKNQVVITDKAKNPAAICRWWDNAFELENSLQTNRGPLGKTLIKEGDGYRSLDATKVLSKEEQDEYSWPNLWIQSLPHYIPAGFKVKEDNPAFDEKGGTDKAYQSALTKKPIPEYWVSVKDSAKFSDEQTAIKDYIKQKSAQWISGQADVDKEWDSYVKQLDTLGLQDYIKTRLDAIKQK
ncbi:extracellular solute-binding protein [Clostridium sp. YIM B02515]|uniref:Extracellular solute-binding protein n=1 Tax=Clostridium rhizosphaerae TaxID=2803861 RepID=A0ABS1T9Y2_9CLOT|nr:extracellular solute-binding protein [Clostridium rhizosphaerae]MBL4936168.1 extracellular solute-binding protein [Clostridium rhizosphaerae]